MKIKEGVEAGLCGSCEHALIHEDIRGIIEVFCEWHHPAKIIHAPLTRCSHHQAKGHLGRAEMERIAWTLDIKGGKIIGFSPPKKKED